MATHNNYYVFVRQGGLGKGSVLTFMIVLLILASCFVRNEYYLAAPHCGVALLDLHACSYGQAGAYYSKNSTNSY